MNPIRQLGAPRNLHPVNSRHYRIEKLTGAQWLPVAYAVSTSEADRILAQKTRFENGRFRATEMKVA